MQTTYSRDDLSTLAQQIPVWGKALGFDAVGFSDIDLSVAETQFFARLNKGFYGEMEWMARHGSKRTRPAELEPGTLSVISVRMNYLPPDAADSAMVMNHPELGFISRYALGRDYHKLMRKRLQQLAKKIEEEIGRFSYRVFVDSAPVLEKPIAIKAGLGWEGKHTNVLSRESGSWFFLGEIYTDLPLEQSAAQEAHCGTCTACMDICPTQAIVAPYELDARRCISYLTIELKGSIPEKLRPLMGNRIYGCDDCQLICPWNRFAQYAELDDFSARHNLDVARLVDLFLWTDDEFLKNMEGSAIRRIGHEQWLRNIAVALGNHPQKNVGIDQVLQQRMNDKSDLVREHVGWALAQRKSKELTV